MRLGRKSRQISAALAPAAETGSAASALTRLIPPMRFGSRVAFGLFCLSVLGAVISLSGTSVVAPALASEGCPNEALRAQSNINPTTGQPYALNLPECRAYEMVSPLDKQQHDAMPLNKSGGRVATSLDGDGVDWSSEGAFAGAENYTVRGEAPKNPYVSYRSATGWITRSAFPPAELIPAPENSEVGGILMSTNFSAEAECGATAIVSKRTASAMRCAITAGGQPWAGTPEYTNLTGTEGGGLTVDGATSDASAVVLHGQPGFPLLASDTSEPATCEQFNCGALYEVTGLGSSDPHLGQVDVDSDGEMIGPNNPVALGGPTGDYHAISKTGNFIYFTATPESSVPTLYSHLDDGETVTISGPSPSCGSCSGPAQPATFQGASASGERVFLTTNAQLTSSDGDSGSDLYEFDFGRSPGQRLAQISAGGLGDVRPGSGAEVVGILAIAEDGSHVYFAARGDLTSLPNGVGEHATSVPVAGEENVYGYDTETGETQFVATLPAGDAQLWGQQVVEGSGTSNIRLAQVTPDGRYLVFDTFARLIASGPEADNDEAQDVYRYDFDTGELARLSVAGVEAAQTGNGEIGAFIGPADLAKQGASPTVDTTTRAISTSGSTVAFVTSEALATTAPGGPGDPCGPHTVVTIGGPGCQVYLWNECVDAHCPNGQAGEVSLISDGLDSIGILYGGMSPSGNDIFFQTRTQLVGQDTDSYGDIYDARVDGGFPAPTPQPSCSGESCQGSSVSVEAPVLPPTVTFGGPGNSTAHRSCRKPSVLRRGKCVKPRRHKRRRGVQQGPGHAKPGTKAQRERGRRDTPPAK